MRTLLLFFLPLLLVSCIADDASEIEAPTDTFDRQVLLAHWADNLIVPAFQNYAAAVGTLQSAAAHFTEAPDEARLAELRTAWQNAYFAWQSVALYNTGPAEAAGLRNAANIYPTDATAIEENIAEENYVLDLPSKHAEQGFPALDYLLHGIADTDVAIIARYKDADQGLAYRTYLMAASNRLHDLSTQVANQWAGDARDAFVDNSGSSGTGSVNSLLNDYLFHYEKDLRAAKIGIPAGVFSSGTNFPEMTEGYYAENISKVLFLAALDATQGFFNGQAFGSNTEGPGVRAYLQHLNEGSESELAAQINGQFDEARTAANALSDNFAQQVEEDNQAMLATYDALQKNVVLLKVDVFQLLNVKVDFVDADGD